MSRQSSLLHAEDPVVTNINSYGTTTKGLPFSASRTSLVSSNTSEPDEEREPLLPSALPGQPSGHSADLVPFESVATTFG